MDDSKQNLWNSLFEHTLQILTKECGIPRKEAIEIMRRHFCEDNKNKTFTEIMVKITKEGIDYMTNRLSST